MSGKKFIYQSRQIKGTANKGDGYHALRTVVKFREKVN